MGKKLKKSLIATTAAIGASIYIPTTAAMAAPINSDGWVTENGNQYFYRNGSKVKNQWVLDANGKWRFLSAFDGSVVKEGWAKDSTGWCYIRDGIWVNHATWAKDNTGWQFIGANGYWNSSVAAHAENPIATATDAVEKAEVSKLDTDVAAAKSIIAQLDDALPEKAELSLRINAVVTKFEVSSVIVADSSHIDVLFSRTVDKTSAETTSNYKLGDDITISKATVQADGKTVRLTLANGDALTNSDNDGYIVKITGIKDSTGVKVNEYYKVLSLYDNVKPEVESVGMKDGLLQIKFSEPIKGADDSTIKITDEDGDEVDLTDKVEIDGDDASVVNISGLSSDEEKDYSISISSSIKDLAGNKLTAYEADFTIEKDNEDPEVESVKAVSLTTLKITFNEPVENNFEVYLDGNLADVDIKAVSGTSDKAYYVTFSDEKSDDDTYKLKISGYKDLASNSGDDYMKYLKFGVDSPELESVKGTIKTFNGDKYAVFTYNQDISGSVDSSDITDVTYIDENDDEVELDSNEIADLAIYDSSDNTLEDYLEDNQFAIALDGLDTGDYTLTLPEGFVDVNDAKSDETDIKFTVSDDAGEDGDVYVDGFKKGTTYNTYYVHFSDEVDSSALDTYNYQVDGDNIFSKAVFTSSDKNEVKLTVKQGAIGNGDEEELSSDYKLTTSGITDADGNDIEDFDSHDTIDEDYYGKHDDDNFDGIVISETTGPAVKKVAMEDLDEFTVTFDEKVDNYDDLDAGDFQVVVDGDSVDIDDIDTDDGITFTITLGDDVDDDYEKIKVGTSSKFDGEDKYGNDGITNSTKTISAD